MSDTQAQSESVLERIEHAAHDAVAAVESAASGVLHRVEAALHIGETDAKEEVGSIASDVEAGASNLVHAVEGAAKSDALALEHTVIGAIKGGATSAVVTTAAEAAPEPVATDALRYETKTYSDGCVVTGIGPLPELSPEQQDAAGAAGTLTIPAAAPQPPASTAPTTYADGEAIVRLKDAQALLEEPSPSEAAEVTSSNPTHILSFMDRGRVMRVVRTATGELRKQAVTRVL